MKKYIKILGLTGVVVSLIVLVLYIPEFYAAFAYEAEHDSFYSAFMVLGGLSESPSRLLGAAVCMLLAFVFHFLALVFSIVQMRYVKVKVFRTNVLSGLCFLFSGLSLIIYFALWMIDYRIPVVVAIVDAVLLLIQAFLNIVPLFISFFKHLKDE